MADILDVQNALAAMAQTAVYPNNTSSPSIANCPVRIFPGWPIPDTLDTDLLSGTAQISIFPQDITRTTTRFETQWYTTNLTQPTITLSINQSGGTITIGGAVSTPQGIMVLYNYNSYPYTIKANDTLQSIATNIANMIPLATASGATITFNNPFSLNANVIFTGTSTREVAREKRMFTVSVWAFNPTVRSQLASAITSSFSAMPRFSLPDGFAAQLVYSGAKEIDMLQKVVCYRRDIHIIVEYAITQAQTLYSIGKPIVDVNGEYDVDIMTMNGNYLTTLDGDNITTLGNQ